MTQDPMPAESSMHYRGLHGTVLSLGLLSIELFYVHQKKIGSDEKCKIARASFQTHFLRQPETRSEQREKKKPKMMTPKFFCAGN